MHPNLVRPTARPEGLVARHGPSRRPPPACPMTPKPSATRPWLPDTISSMSEVPNRSSDPTLAELLRRLEAAYEPERVYLFGSRARGEAGPDSDYDLLVVVPDDAPPERKRSRLAYEALRGTGIAADVLVWTRSALDSRLHLAATLPATVVREGRMLH